MDSKFEYPNTVCAFLVHFILTAQNTHALLYVNYSRDARAAYVNIAELTVTLSTSANIVISVFIPKFYAYDIASFFW
jgi:hypothetical protein